MQIQLLDLKRFELHTKSLAAYIQLLDLEQFKDHTKSLAADTTFGFGKN